MHCLNARDLERVASIHADRGGHGDGLIAVVHVDLAANRTGGSLGNVANLGAVGGDGHSRGLRGQTVAIVELVGLEAGHHANVAALVGLVGLGVAERTGGSGEVAGQTVVVAAVQSQIAVLHRNALLVHDAVAQRHVVVVASSTSHGNHQSALVGGHVHDGHVDVGSQLLTSGGAQTAFLQRIAQFLGVQLPGAGLGEAQRSRNGQLRHVVVVRRNRRANSRGERLSDVGHRTPDGVTSTLHRHRVGVVDGDVAAQDEGVLETFKNVLERDAFFFGKCVCHDGLLNE